MAKYIKIGTCKHCGRQNTSLTMGLCKKHYTQLHENGKFLDCNPRVQKDPNEFIYDSILNCYKIILYDKNSNPKAEALIDLDDYERCKEKKWGITAEDYCISKGEKISLGRFIMKIDNDDKRIIYYINGNSLDNRKNNIKVITRSEKKIIDYYMNKKENEIVGIRYSYGRYASTISIDGKSIYLGSYSNLEDAVYQRRIAEFYLKYDEIMSGILDFPLEYSVPDSYYLDPNSRSINDLNEFIFHEDRKNGDYYEIILFNRKCEPVGSTLIDAEDYEKCKNIKWHLSHTGYVRSSSVNGKNISLHRYVMDYYGDLLIDHQNRIRTDNRKGNLRIIPAKMNSMNKSKSKNNTSGYAGVMEERDKYRANIGVNYKTKNLGLYETKEEAYIARKQGEYIYGYAQMKGSPILYIPDNMYYDWKNNIQYQQQEEKKLIKPLIYEK